MGRPKGIKRPGGPGVARNPLTRREIATLQMIAEGFSPRELAGDKRVERIWKRMGLIRIKLDAFTTEHAVAEGLRKGIIK